MILEKKEDDQKVDKNSGRSISQVGESIQVRIGAEYQAAKERYVLVRIVTF